MNDLLNLIGSHRSIRRYKEKMIDPTILKTIIEKAQYASTSSYVQAYSVIRIKNKETRKQLSQLCGDQKYIEQAAEFLVFCADLKRLHDVTIKHGKEPQEGYVESMIIATVDAALLGQNVMLGAESVGLGGVFIGGIRNQPTKVCELLDIPPNVYPVFGMCLGYPDQAPDQKPRLPLKLILKEETYTEEDISELEHYDARVKSYYINRTRGKIDHTWTEQMAEKMGGELRPHMRSYLEKWSFNKR